MIGRRAAIGGLLASTGLMPGTSARASLLTVQRKQS